MASFAEQIAKYQTQDPLDPQTFLSEMWQFLTPSQQEMFSAMLSQPQNVRRDVAVQGAQGNMAGGADAMGSAPQMSAIAGWTGPIDATTDADGKPINLPAGEGRYIGGQHNGQIYRQLPDGTIVTIDVKTGKELGRENPRTKNPMGASTSYDPKFTPAGQTNVGALSGKAPTGVDGVRQVPQQTGAPKYEHQQTGNEVMKLGGGGTAQVGQTIDPSKAQDPLAGAIATAGKSLKEKTRIKLRSGEWIGVGGDE